jgi:hypothetical protein
MERKMSNHHTRPALKEDYPSLRKPERLHIGVLQERRDYLRRRLSKGDHSDGAGPFLAGEASSLEWALEQIDALYGTDQVDGISRDEMAVAMLESLCADGEDPRTTLQAATRILLDAVSPEVKQAYEQVLACTSWVAA